VIVVLLFLGVVVVVVVALLSIGLIPRKLAKRETNITEMVDVAW
jgi:hypothetical protein